MNLLKKILIPSIIIGTIIYYWTMFTGIIQTPFINKIYANGMTINTFNFYGYFENLLTGWVEFDALSLQFPPRQFNGDILNNLALVFDWIYLPLNIVLYITRFCAYLIRNVLQIFGFIVIPKEINGVIYMPSPIIETLNWVMANLQIPYL